jgi:hypothetical protein
MQITNFDDRSELSTNAIVLPLNVYILFELFWFLLLDLNPLFPDDAVQYTAV